MADVYVVGLNDALEQAKPFYCADEERELQNLLHRNPEQLLVGDQIDPKEPRRWLLIKKEMSVPDPVSGASRWSIDFLYVDQDATLTFVECKRHKDTRSRREVIGQIVDYAANAASLWDATHLIKAARQQAEVDGKTLEAQFEALGQTAFATVEALLQAARDRVANRDLRIIILLEKAPPELKPMVEFLNKEMNTAELLLIETKMYEAAGRRIVIPQLYGFTDEIRARRQAIAVATGSRRTWDDDSFRADVVQQSQSAADRAAILAVYESAEATGFSVDYGHGAVASLNLRLPDQSPLALVTVKANGEVVVNFGSFKKPEHLHLMKALADFVRTTGKQVPDNYVLRSYISIPIREWNANAEVIIRALKGLAATAPP